ncbi:hypothetical protein [Caldivirga sp. UBA161]|uniref:hypothetical protein n=1 Tax=Caldivirga sp. UBA161 TaxID=1915569 RepID=UPI0025C4B795|nr:hypothetical protein [Caldivirga sp. UBA161]
MLGLALAILTLGLLKAPVIYLYSGGNYLLAVVVNFTSTSQYSQVYVVNSSGWFKVNAIPGNGQGVLVTNTYQYGDQVYLLGFSSSGPLLIRLRLGNNYVTDITNLSRYLPVSLQPYALTVLNDTVYVFGIMNGYASAFLINLSKGSIVNLTGIFKGVWSSSTPISAAMQGGSLLILAMSSNLTPLLGLLNGNEVRTVNMPQIKGLPLGLFQFNNEALIPIMTVKQSSSTIPVMYLSGVDNTYTMGTSLLYYDNGTLLNFTNCINPSAVIFDVYWVNATTALLGGGIVNDATWEPYLSILNINHCKSTIIPVGLSGAIFAVLGNWIGGGLNVVYNITTLLGEPFVMRINYTMSISNPTLQAIPSVQFSLIRGSAVTISEVVMAVVLVIGLTILILLMFKTKAI